MDIVKYCVSKAEDCSHDFLGASWVSYYKELLLSLNSCKPYIVKITTLKISSDTGNQRCSSNPSSHSPFYPLLPFPHQPPLDSPLASSQTQDGQSSPLPAVTSVSLPDPKLITHFHQTVLVSTQRPPASTSLRSQRAADVLISVAM